MNQNQKSLIYLSLGLVLALLFVPLYLLYKSLSSRQVPEAKAPAASVQGKPDNPVVVPESKPVPETANLVVPYTVQAPYANWKVHEESCEEAALLMYHDFLTDQKTDIDPASADRELRALKAWQVQNWGAERDLSLEKVGQLAADYYGHKYTALPSLTQDEIKSQVSTGHPVLVPVMTQALKNPHYNPGSVYHILLIKGYDSTGVITNDAGVKEGKDWHYSWDILWSAVDTQNQKMGQGRVGLILD